MANYQNKLQIAIIGAGWFGCHIASELLDQNNRYEIDLFEKEKDIFLGASGNNQNRLHLGYHYPRSFFTRTLSKRGFKKFLKKYPNHSNKINNNIYAIADDHKNITDFKTYIQILKATDLKYKFINPKKFGLKNITGAIKSDERKINALDAKSFFKKKLKKILFLNKKIKTIKKTKNYFIIDKKKYNFVINCTYQQSFSKKEWNLYYEPCIILIYQANKKHPAITIMDGPFITMYPWEKNRFSVYSVKNSRIGKTKKIATANKILNEFSNKEKYFRKKNIENEIIKFYPKFKRFFKFKRFSMSIRTIDDTEIHSRESKLAINDRFVSILSGKIDHIFYASEKIEEYLKKYH